MSPLHLAAAIDLPGIYGAGPFAELALLAERGALDFVTLEDSFGRSGPDALGVLARVAPRTARVGLVPTVTTTHTEPFHVQAAVATLDWVSHGRAGWCLDVSASEAEARLFGRRHAAPRAELWREAGEVADVAARLWDSWEDDAEIRDVATGRFIDRDKLHYVDFTAGTFSVRGPSIVPRPPQGHPVTVVDATAPHARDTAARYADVALVRTTGLAEADAARAELRAAAAGFGRDPDSLRVLADRTVDLGEGERVVDLAELIASWHASGAVDGFHLRFAEPRRDLERLVNGTVELLKHRGLFRTFYPGGTLRDHLGLARPANRYAARTGDPS
ncbi:LLM class flavin-dependent oxidoreductase [Streptomyces sp. NPDC050658]|uniref:LLM class flavin-dependent oxidoreductase n=1 Tax=unclassified Streptomyces TaxID=2593676 RepID=UPI00341AF7C6